MRAACGLVDSVHRGGNFGRRDHAPGDRFAVQEMPVSGLGLERVADGMAEVQHPAQTIFALVGGNYFGFQLD